MTSSYKVEALPMGLFEKYFVMSEKELTQHDAKIITAHENPGYPCRVSLQDAEVGEKVLAIKFPHHDVDSPYSASGPIFVRQIAKTSIAKKNEIPDMLKHRQISLRAYDSHNMMINACVVNGNELDKEIKIQFENSSVQYLHVHNAGPGCFNCSVKRA